jgi:hypothetical protein
LIAAMALERALVMTRSFFGVEERALGKENRLSGT